MIIHAGNSVAAAAIEDDAHRFEIAIEHDGAAVTSVHADAIRFPYTSCTGAKSALRSMVGLPLTIDATEAARRVNASLCCTHQFDTVALAIAQCARGPGTRRYDATVRVSQSERAAKLHRDGQPVLAWTVRDQRIESDDPADGHSVRTVLRDLHGREDLSFIEAIFVMRRALLVAPGRTRPPEAHLEPREMLGRMQGACHSFQPETARQGTLIRTHFRDFEDAPDALLAGWDGAAIIAAKGTSQP